MEDLTPETLAELRRLYDAATPGGWGIDPVDLQYPDKVNVGDSGGGYICLVDERGIPMEQEANAALIAAMHNALPAMLDRLEKLERAAKDFLAHGRDESGRCLMCGTDDDDHYNDCSLAALEETK